MNGTVVALFVCPQKGDPMQAVSCVTAIAGRGLEGDRYCNGEGSFSKSSRLLERLAEKLLLKSHRQVTLINSGAFNGSGFTFSQSRRNIVVSNEIQLMWLIGKKFQVGDAIFQGVKYCVPCNRPSKLSGKEANFKDVFHDRGGLVAEVIKGGRIRLDDLVIPPTKGY